MSGITILGLATASVADAKALARKGQPKQLAQVDLYLDTLYTNAPKYNLDPAGMTAQSAEETDGWSSAIWQSTLNPAGLAITGPNVVGPTYHDGAEAAWAHIVHLLVYARPSILHKVDKQYLRLDTTFASPWYAGYAGIAEVYNDLSKRWAVDPLYGANIEAWYKRLLAVSAKPQPTPQPTPGSAPLPSGIVAVTSSNWNERTNGQQPVAIVYHITDDMDVHRVLNWFADPTSNASSQAVIDRDGTIYQVVSSTRTAWTNNDIKNPRTDIAWLNKAITVNWINGGPYSINDFTLSIEHVGTPSDPPTEAQYKSSIALSKYWRDRYHIKPNRGHLLRHADINSVDRSYCPGPQFDLARIIHELGGDPADMSS